MRSIDKLRKQMLPAPNCCIKLQVKGDLALYWSVRGEISVGSDLLLYGTLIIISKGLQAEMMHKIHQGFQGILKCRQWVATAVWWPGVHGRWKQSGRSGHAKLDHFLLNF